MSLLAAAFLAACSGDYCSRAQGVNLASKRGTCDGGFATNTCAVQATCETALKGCTSDDQSTLNKQIDCLNGLPTCQAGQEASWGGQFISCFTSNAPSQACQSSFATALADGGC